MLIDNSSSTSSKFDSETVTISCEPGYELTDSAGNVLANSVHTCDPSSSDSAQCATSSTIDFTCERLKCVNEDPCAAHGFTSVSGTNSNGVYNENDEVVCKCSDPFVTTSVGCKVTCQVNVNANFMVSGCSCTEKQCAKAGELPHGKLYLAGEETDGAIDSGFVFDVNNVYNYTKVNVGSFVAYQCDAGYQLKSSFDDSTVTDSKACSRQCYKPLESTCGGTNGHKHNGNPSPVLDPIACYCAPMPCPAHQSSNMREYLDQFYDPVTASHNVVNPGDSSVETVCKEGTFAVDGFFKEKHFCSENAGSASWSTATSCVPLSCPDPRSLDAEAIEFSPTLNLKHTIRHMDRWNYQTDSGNWASTTTGGFIIKDTIAYNITGEFPVYGQNKLPNAGYGHRYFIQDGDVNVANGVTHTFTCKKGFRPYLNVISAAQSNNWGPLRQQDFTCSCMDGKWQCHESCRCDAYCSEGEL